MKRFALPLLTASLLVATGCAHRTYVAVAPPPPGYGQQAPPLIQVAERNGFGAGSAAGSRDAATGHGYHPQHDRAFHETPGYDPSLGPRPAYRSAFRSAYMRGYDEGFHRPHGMQ